MADLRTLIAHFREIGFDNIPMEASRNLFAALLDVAEAAQAFYGVAMNTRCQRRAATCVLMTRLDWLLEAMEVNRG